MFFLSLVFHPLFHSLIYFCFSALGSFSYLLRAFSSISDLCPYMVFSTCTDPIIHLFYLPKFCIIIVCKFSWDMKVSHGRPRVIKNNAYGGERGVCIMDCASSELAREESHARVFVCVCARFIHHTWGLSHVAVACGIANGDN